MITNKERLKVMLSKAEQIKLLEATLQDCAAFLSTWRVDIPLRAETMQDALLAITEVERMAREELDILLYGAASGKHPF